jgi:hypothetical protein
MWYSAVVFIVTLALSLLVAPLTAEAQQPAPEHLADDMSHRPPRHRPTASTACRHRRSKRQGAPRRVLHDLAPRRAVGLPERRSIVLC